jgi:hypothetical protein
MIKFFSFKKLMAIAILSVFFAPFVAQAFAAQSTGKKLVLPRRAGRGGDNDFNNPDSEYCFKRSVQGPDVVIFWSKEYGQDPMKNSDLKRTFDVNYMLSECERYYKAYVDDLKIVVKGKSVTDKYKLIVYVIGGPSGTATGGGDGDIGTLNTPAVRVNRPPYGVLAHEMIHSFQSMSRADGQRGGGIPAEMAAQYGLWQVLPDWMEFENYHLVAWMNATHLSFGASENMYHTAQVMEYWSFKHGQQFYGDMLRSTVPGDAITTYTTMYNLNQEQFNDELFDGYRRFMTWDIPRIDKVARKYANQHHTDMNAVDGGWFQIAKTKTPQNYGYNGIKLKVPAAGTNVVLDFKGIAGAAGYSNINVDKAGWRYGFVAYLKNDSRVYGDVGKGKEGKLTFKVPADCNYLWLVVMGAPTEHPASAGGRGFGGGRGAANTIARQVTAMSDLSLKPDQLSKLNAMSAADANIANAVTAAQAPLNAAVVAGDEAKIKEVINNITVATEKNALAQAAEYKKIKAILTDAQYKQMTTALTAPPGGRGGRGGAGGAGAPGGGQAQWPYQIKLTGTTVDDSVLGKR